MAQIDGVALSVTTVGRVAARRRDAGAGGFSLPAAPEPEPAALSPTACLSGLDGLLALQEAQTDAVGEREVRRRGDALLTALKRLQLAMLTQDGVGRHDLRRLADLAAALPYSADPALGDLLRAIGLRARIELARCPLPATDAILSCVPPGATPRAPL